MRKLICTIILILASSNILAEEVPLGIAHNNPLNIMETPIKWKGETTCEDSRTEVNGQRTECFISWKYGVRAAIIILYNYQELHEIDTLEGLVNRWATGNREEYISFLEGTLGIDRDTKFKLEGNPIFITFLINAMIEFENGEIATPQSSGNLYNFDEIYEIAVFMDWTR